MPWPEVKLTVRRPADGEGRGAALRRVFAFGLDGDFLLAPDVEFALRVGLLVNFAALGGRRDGIKDAALGDARLDVLRDELVAVAGDADAGVFGSEGAGGAGGAGEGGNNDWAFNV